MSARKITVFVDVDGVLSIPNTADIEERRQKFGWGLVGWPVPMAYALVRALSDDPTLRPVWLTAWDRGGRIWNERAGTRLWPVGYHLTNRTQANARRLYPHLAHAGLDHKLLAAAYFAHRKPAQQVIWLEDGFAPETRAWAAACCQQGCRVILVDATDERMRAALLAEYDDCAGAARAFVETWLLDEVS